MRIAGRLELCLPILGPIMNRLKVSALLRHRKVAIISLLALVPPDRHDADVGVAEERLPQVVEAVPVVPAAQTRRVIRVFLDRRRVVELLPYAVLGEQSVVDAGHKAGGRATRATIPLTRQCSWWNTSNTPAYPSSPPYKRAVFWGNRAASSLLRAISPTSRTTLQSAVMIGLDGVILSVTTPASLSRSLLKVRDSHTIGGSKRLSAIN